MINCDTPTVIKNLADNFLSTSVIKSINTGELRVFVVPKFGYVPVKLIVLFTITTFVTNIP